MGKLIPNQFNLLVVIAAALGSTCCSYGMSVISSTIGQPSFFVNMGLAAPGEPGYDHTAELIGAFNGFNSAGSLLAALFTAWTCDKYSRLRSMQLGCITSILGAALCGGSVDVAMFLVARFISGWGVGMLITVFSSLERLAYRRLTCEISAFPSTKPRSPLPSLEVSWYAKWCSQPRNMLIQLRSLCTA